jgi:hypothetical protein
LVGRSIATPLCDACAVKRLASGGAGVRSDSLSSTSRGTSERMLMPGRCGDFLLAELLNANVSDTATIILTATVAMILREVRRLLVQSTGSGAGAHASSILSQLVEYPR